ncbi:hypothetical protein PsYK624_156770 [Phanerochaete sordida]|uniref:Uncharacterized protein n=1 Tax=Phanerochaete sordida TaxID=48140 RepID=A0A9P3LLI1_9APHY|nr:hypothetical protein PsYK624_156770 [Phanerochaete sordida]
MSPLRVGPLRVEFGLVAAPAVLLLRHRVVAAYVVTQFSVAVIRCLFQIQYCIRRPQDTRCQRPSPAIASTEYACPMRHRTRPSRRSWGSIFLGPGPTGPLARAHQHPTLAPDARMKSQPTTT